MTYLFVGGEISEHVADQLNWLTNLVKEHADEYEWPAAVLIEWTRDGWYVLLGAPGHFVFEHKCEYLHEATQAAIDHFAAGNGHTNGCPHTHPITYPEETP